MVNPVERIDLLSQIEEPAFSTLEFHESLIDIFQSLRDLHTRYLLPLFPFRGNVAFLPFLIEEFYDENDEKRANPRYVVFFISSVLKPTRTSIPISGPASRSSIGTASISRLPCGGVPTTTRGATPMPTAAGDRGTDDSSAFN